VGFTGHLAMEKSMRLRWAGYVAIMEVGSKNAYKILEPLGSLSCTVWMHKSIVRSEVEWTSCGTHSVVAFGISYAKYLVVLLIV
jgi:hypothetical protein